MSCYDIEGAADKYHALSDHLDRFVHAIGTIYFRSLKFRPAQSDMIIAKYSTDPGKTPRDALIKSDFELLSSAAKEIMFRLTQQEICFEGQALPVSLIPTVVSSTEVSKVRRVGFHLRRALSKIICQFIQEHKERIFDGPPHRFFTPYYKWWDLIAAEVRREDHIQLMRYDAIRDDDRRWLFMETNTSCPGGTIHCARIRDAWRTTQFGTEICKNKRITEYPIDAPQGFVQFMSNKAERIDSDHPNIAILNYRGTYTNELKSLQECHRHQREIRNIDAGELLLGDVRDLTFMNGRVHLQGKPIALIYNKLDQQQINPHDPEIKAWTRASTDTKTEFLNSLGAMYLAETKRTLALLSDPTWSQHLNLTELEATAIKEVIPFTRLVEDFVARDLPLTRSRVAMERQAFVLKADCLTRGSGVFIGDQVNDQVWLHAIESTRANQGVVQIKCRIPSRIGLQLAENGEISRAPEFYGVDIFFFGSDFAGMVSRAHVDQVFNVGNGGRESPVLVVKRDSNE